MEKENRFSEVAIEKKKIINFFWQAIHGSCNGMFVVEKLKTLISRYIYKRMLFNWWNTYEHAENKNFSKYFEML